MSKEKPILFSGEMVRAILEGRKTQTRRVVKRIDNDPLERGRGWMTCPYGQAGDRLWVRETWCAVREARADAPAPADYPSRYQKHEDGELTWVDYRATPWDAASHPAGWHNAPDDHEALRWKPSIHMPRWASRITLEVTSVRAERLQDISEQDAEAEGCHSCRRQDARTAFSHLWANINTKDGRRWDDNPWVWVVEFKRQ